jgi:sulfhydrogenase subunit beta (sulfur reductase)
MNPPSRKRSSLQRKLREKVSSQVPTDQAQGKGDVNELFNAPFWERVLCLHQLRNLHLSLPTCWCFDIQDEVQGKEGDRIRNWDACMFPLFTLHGSGPQPQGQEGSAGAAAVHAQVEVLRGQVQTAWHVSGCGRCVQHCPVNIDIREVCELMNG